MLLSIQSSRPHTMMVLLCMNCLSQTALSTPYLEHGVRGHKRQQRQGVPPGYRSLFQQTEDAQISNDQGWFVYQLDIWPNSLVV
jgi:hypothetical protein